MESHAAFAKKRLGALQVEIDGALKYYLEKSFGVGAYPYHLSASMSVDIFKDIVTRPAKRLRGAFVNESYSMFSDKINEDVMLAAVAIEVIHAYLLVIDDFNDRSDLRRGLPTAHRLHEKFHKEKHFHGDALHYGYSAASVSVLFGMHHASNLLLSLNFPSDVLVKAVQGVNDAINVTAYGQIRDIYNQQAPGITEQDVIEVHRYKTAHYTYFNPIQLGATLAGVPDETISKFKTYTENAGIAFQIQDDILGVFGDPKDTGKSNMDDTTEGKDTLLTVFALEHGTPAQKEILMNSIGNRDLTEKQFEAFRKVIVETGSLEHSKEVALGLVQEAKESMYKEFPEYTSKDGFKFITGVADYMIERKL